MRVPPSPRDLGRHGALTLFSALPPLIAGGGIFADYLAGRFYFLPIANFAPALLLAVSMMIFSWAAALIVLLCEFRRNPRRLPKALVLASSVAVTVLAIGCALQTRPYLLGLRDSVFFAGSPDEFREAAQVINEMLPFGRSPLEGASSLPGPGKWSIWTEERDRPRWTEVTRRAPCIRRLESSVWIFRQEHCVAFVWGGALVGHSGFRIGHDPSVGGELERLRYTDDIVFFMSE